MEWPGKKTITSKDILRSLSEAREDHLRQPNYLPSTITTGTRRDVASARNDPWNVAAPFSSTNTNLSDSQQQHKEYRLESELDVGGNEGATCLSSFARACVCCGCPCDRARGRHQRRRLQYVGSNPTTEEEGEYLMDCDELGLTWESNS